MAHHVTVPGDQFWNLYAFVSTSRHIILDFVCLFITIVSFRCVAVVVVVVVYYTSEPPQRPSSIMHAIIRRDNSIDPSMSDLSGQILSKEAPDRCNSVRGICRMELLAISSFAFSNSSAVQAFQRTSGAGRAILNTRSSSSGS